MERTVFFTVVYPGVEKYFRDFVVSLAQQTCTDFDLLVGNDGVKELDLSECGLRTKIVDLSGTPAKIRSKGLRLVREMGYEYAIFGDSDDFFSLNRVEVSLRLLKSHEVVVNDLDLVDVAGKNVQSAYLSQRLEGGTELAADFIRDKNIFGLSNTAARVECLPDFEIPAEIVAADWFIFATMLERGSKGIFTAFARTAYRQHGANIAGLGAESPQILLQAVRVKARHYAAMTAAGWECYRRSAAAFNDLFQRLNQEANFRAEYCDFLKTASRDFPVWWENALLPEEHL